MSVINWAGLPWLMIGVTLVYCGQVAVSLYQGQYPQAAIVGGYTIANLGLIATMVR